MGQVPRHVHQSWGVRRVFGILTATAWVRTTIAIALGLSIPVGAQATSSAILVAVKEGPSGEFALREWSKYSGSSLHGDGSATVWVLCTSIETEVAVSKLPYVQPFLVENISSWVQVFDDFYKFLDTQHQPTSIAGLFGEGSLPHPELSESIQSLGPSLGSQATPTAILTRSQSRGDGAGLGCWMSDSLVAQIWCNRALLAPTRVNNLNDLQHQSPTDTTLLEVLPRLLQDPPGMSSNVVDGTQVLRSIVDFDYLCAPGEVVDANASLSNLKAKGEELNPVRIGSVGLALIFDGERYTSSDGTPSRGGTLFGRFDDQRLVRPSIVKKAPWPPEYVLETVATKDNLVIVSNVNCGYLDMAANFMMSVRRTTDVQVLFVAMDDVSFDVMDALAPGCTALFPSHHHATKAGAIGDDVFAQEVLVRPSIINHILKQNYSVLWTDSDMIWLDSPLSLLPDLEDSSTADVLLQYDGSAANKCTCFMFLKSTVKTQLLVKLWGERIIALQANKNQGALQGPLQFMRQGGLKVEFLPLNVMPAGKDFFDHAYLEDYVRLYHNDTVIVHNNWIEGHESKKGRFQEYNLWVVEGIAFPDCETSRHRRVDIVLDGAKPSPDANFSNTSGVASITTVSVTTR